MTVRRAVLLTVLCGLAGASLGCQESSSPSAIAVPVATPAVHRGAQPEIIPAAHKSGAPSAFSANPSVETISTALADGANSKSSTPVEAAQSGSVVIAATSTPAAPDQATAADAGSAPSIDSTPTELSTAASGPRAIAEQKPAEERNSSDTRTPPTASAGTVQVLNFDDIKFDMEKGGEFKREMITKKIEGYFGRSIRIKGYMLPSFQQSGITNFVLTRDNRECCFGPGAALYDCIIVDLPQGKGCEFTVRPVSVEGVLEFKELLDFDDNVVAIYHLDAKQVD